VPRNSIPISNLGTAGTHKGKTARNKRTSSYNAENYSNSYILQRKSHPLIDTKNINQQKLTHHVSKDNTSITRNDNCITNPDEHAYIVPRKEQP
jgi:hypothetical protein